MRKAEEEHEGMISYKAPSLEARNVAEGEATGKPRTRIPNQWPGLTS